MIFLKIKSNAFCCIFLSSASTANNGWVYILSFTRMCLTWIVIVWQSNIGIEVVYLRTRSVRYRKVSLGNLSVKTSRLSRFGAGIDSGCARCCRHATIEWEISLYVRLGPGTDMSDYFWSVFWFIATRKVLRWQKGNGGKYGGGWLQLLPIIVARAPPSFVQPGLLTPGLYYWLACKGGSMNTELQGWTKAGEELAEDGKRMDLDKKGENIWTSSDGDVEFWESRGDQITRWWIFFFYIFEQERCDMWVKQPGHCLDKWSGVRTNVSGLIQQEYVSRAWTPA